VKKRNEALRELMKQASPGGAEVVCNARIKGGKRCGKPALASWDLCRRCINCWKNKEGVTEGARPPPSFSLILNGN